MNSRPLSITLIGWLFICVGCGSIMRGAWGFASDTVHGGVRAIRGHDVLDVALAWASGLVAILGGAFVLGGRPWARWLCAVWLGFHVLLNLVHPNSKVAIHALFFVGISYLLFRPGVAAYFRTTGAT